METGDEQKVVETILKVLEAGRRGDADEIKQLHADGFTRFSEFPPYSLQERDEAIKLKSSLYTELVDFKYDIRDMRVKVFNGIALATFILSYEGMYIYSYTFEGRDFRMRVRCTVVLLKEGSEWKIIHEHYSPISDEYE